MSLALLPDFAALRQDADEREQAIEMARATLAPYLGTKGATAKLREGVLADTLRGFARAGGGGLDQLIDMLSDLPDDVSTIDDAPKLASAIANQLRAAIATNPLLQSRGSALDPAVLFQAAAGKTRISVLNLSGLGSDEARQSFVNQLQMSLFTWIKRNPSPTGRLYVLDEAQNFAPSQKMTPCKESTVSLAAQARKYGLGMIFATQTPKGIDNKIISNCTTHFYGRMSSPATIEATRELMTAKGGSGEDIGRLSSGRILFLDRGRPAADPDSHAPLPHLAPGKSAHNRGGHGQSAREPIARAGDFVAVNLPTAARLFLQKARELFLEARQSAAAVDQVLLAAGPGRMRLRIDIEMQRIAGLAPGRAGGEFGAVGHDHLDQVVIGVGVGFHVLVPSDARFAPNFR